MYDTRMYCNAYTYLRPYLLRSKDTAFVKDNHFVVTKYIFIQLKDNRLDICIDQVPFIFFVKKNILWRQLIRKSYKNCCHKNNCRWIILNRGIGTSVTMAQCSKSFAIVVCNLLNFLHEHKTRQFGLQQVFYVPGRRFFAHRRCSMVTESVL